LCGILLKMEKKFQERIPSNARIYINHEKDIVRFKYPNKEKPFWICFKSFLSLWLLFNTIILLVNSTWIIPLIFTSGSWDGIIIDPLSIALLFHAFFIPVTLSLLFVNNEKLLKLMPKINKLSALFPFREYYYKKITKLNSKTFKIPSFSNVFLNYNAEGDFAKFLKEVEIKEYDFEVIKKGILKKKKKKNDMDWYAVFRFSRIPKSGNFEIRWI